MNNLTFNYQLLGRLEQDCTYYLGYGNRQKRVLWALDEQEQINKMRELYNSFPEDKKPNWITLEKIAEYENIMLKDMTDLENIRRLLEKYILNNEFNSLCIAIDLYERIGGKEGDQQWEKIINSINLQIK